MLSEKLLARHTLDNGLLLEFWDLSRPVAGDRWEVVLEARIKVPITVENLAPELGSSLDEVISALGPEVIFSQKEMHLFIASREVIEIINEIENRLLSSLSAYWGHPDFAGRFIRKKFAEYQEKKLWRQF